MALIPFGPEPDPARRLLHKSDVAVMTGLSPSSIRRLELRGEFPRRVYLTPQRVAWASDEVADWVATRLAERSAA